MQDSNFDFTKYLVEETLAGRVIHLYHKPYHYELMQLDLEKLRD